MRSAAEPQLPRAGPLLVKLGGSLATSPRLDDWLAAIVQPQAVARLIVPGGGMFADAVRRAQRRFRFSDFAAHGMAILAMQQYALWLMDRSSSLRPAETAGEIAALAADGAAGVWLPWALAGRTDELPASWDVTSDSLALWLALRVAAPGVLVVKRARSVRNAGVDALRAAGVVDPAFAGLLDLLRCPVHIVHEDAPESLADFVATCLGQSGNAA